MIILTNKDRTPFQIDEEDHETVSRFSWWINTGYPCTKIRTGKGYHEEYRHIRIYVFLLGPAPIGFEWDHINRDRLDNRRSNLRIVTPSENRRNRKLLSSNTSGAAGVRLVSIGKWKVYIQVENHTFHIGTYDSFDSAVDARKLAELKYWGSIQSGV